MLTPSETIFRSALKSVDPAAAMAREVSLKGSELVCGPHRLNLEDTPRRPPQGGTLEDTPRRPPQGGCARIFVVAVGKAAAPMASALERILGERISSGIVLVKDGYGAGFHSQRLKLLEGAHPYPEARNLEATRQILELVDQAGPEDLVIVLLSGGASALLEQPLPGVTLADLREANRVLLASGANIVAVNAIRQRLSAVKGGGLLRHIRPALCLTLVLSDVLGNPLWAIGSGPTVPACPLAESIRETYGIVLPPYPYPPSSDSAMVHIIGDNRRMALAACEAARSLGYPSRLLTAYLEGEAREVGIVLAGIARELARNEERPTALIASGETTVSLHGGGRGGRCTELALSFALAGQGLSGVTLLAGASDGTDGPTPAAGAIVTGGTVERARKLGLSPEQALKDQDRFTFFSATGELLQTGPTGTNTNDLLVLLVD